MRIFQSELNTPNPVWGLWQLALLYLAAITGFNTTQVFERMVLKYKLKNVREGNGKFRLGVKIIRFEFSTFDFNSRFHLRLNYT